LKTGCFPNVS